MAKLLKLRRGTTTQHASFTGAEGELTIDTTKDTAVVHDGSQAGGRPLLREDMSNLPAGTIDNADVNASAAISGTKISPDFGSQDITTTGKIKFANVYTNESDLPSASTYHGMFAHVHSTGLAYFAHAGNWIKLAKLDAPDFTGGIDVTGNISVTGTVDGRDVAADGTKLDGIESGATADQTASEINALLNNENVTCAGLDAGSGLIRTNGWFYNDDSGEGLYNSATTQHFYSDDDDYWNIAGGSGANGLRFRDDHASSIRGYVYANNSSQIGFLNASGNWSFKCDNSGNVTATGNVTAYSDARLKTDIHTINDALSICGKLRGVSYKWIKDGKASIGVIAQEIEEVLPEVVLTQQVKDPTGETEVKSVDYGKIVGVLINAINELKEEVEELKNAKITG